MKVKILFYLLENSRFVLRSTLTFGYANVCFFFLQKFVSQFKETVLRVQIYLTVHLLVIFATERNYSFYITDQLCDNSFLCVLLSPEVTCEHAWSPRHVGSTNVELEGQKRNKGYV